MADVYIDHTKQTLAADPGTWGDLLAILDQQVADRQLLVTAIRLDGVEEPAFRHPSATDRPLSAVGRVDVETASPAAVVRQCCADAEDAVGEIATRVLELASQFRLQNVQPAHAGLVRLAEDLRGLLTLLQAMLESRGPDQDWLAIDGVSAHDQMVQLGECLDSLVAAQTSQDCITVSDILEYDLEPALRRWERKMREVAARAVVLRFHVRS